MAPVASKSAHAFREDWARYHAGRQPVGWMLRADQMLPWIRFHALPESNRYAESDAERAEILRRANELGELVLGPNSQCWIVDARPDGGRPYDPAVLGEPAGIYEDGDEVTWRYYVREAEWRQGAFDEKLLAIADDQGLALWMSRKDGTVFAPYDGGFDLFPRTIDQVRMLREAYPDWLSSHPLGL